MDLPSARELELEILLREKDVQLAEVTDEISALRRYLSKQPGPSTTDSITLPPALISFLLPHISNTEASTSASSSSTVNIALTQRARLLQEENNELYELLKHSETGNLKDEVRGLRKVVVKLEGALKESHQVITSLSTELEKAYETLRHTTRQNKSKASSQSHSPQDSHNSMPVVDGASNGHSASRPLPTEPRAHKRPRLSEPRPRASPTRLAASLPQKPQVRNHSPHPLVRADSRETGRNFTDNRGRVNVKMEVDEGEMGPSTTNRERDRIRERERNAKDRERGTKERDRPSHIHTSKDRDRDGGKNPHTRRNGHSMPGRSGAPGRKGNNPNTSQTPDQGNRTLQQRLGL
ncbi:hypothetical protein CPB84DRAFT_1758174 [Gymnopilus junonius]|uniref:Uncharacterized protein n=1 Tax=Gymnopilus junonius TaxID=109634 RepID=A0A9P5P397_GYMJU|nr:hypothetical protein CPB84DRAFT_1758174 [Gymnopilus junonius]